MGISELYLCPPRSRESVQNVLPSRERIERVENELQTSRIGRQELGVLRSPECSRVVDCSCVFAVKSATQIELQMQLGVQRKSRQVLSNRTS